jgi:hypothetical protein
MLEMEQKKYVCEREEKYFLFHFHELPAFFDAILV